MEIPFKINPGPMVERFSDIVGATKCLPGGQKDYSEVVEWMESYINGPWPEQLLPLLEPTQLLRAQHIKQYVKWRVESSVTGRVKEFWNDKRRADRAEAVAAAEDGSGVCEGEVGLREAGGVQEVKAGDPDEGIRAQGGFDFGGAGA